MADDYLGRKMEEYMARKASGQSNRRPLATLGRLLLKNRSHRGYDTGFAVGKGIEKIELVPIGPSDSHTYYRENGTHYVPKLRAEELTIKE